MVLSIVLDLAQSDELLVYFNHIIILLFISSIRRLGARTRRQLRLRLVACVTVTLHESLLIILFWYIEKEAIATCLSHLINFRGFFGLVEMTHVL